MILVNGGIGHFDPPSGDGSEGEQEPNEGSDSPRSQDSEREEGAEEVGFDDGYGPPMPKGELAEMLREQKRIDDVEPNFCLNLLLISTYHQTLLGGGSWGAKAKKTMREKHFLSPAQYRQLDAPTLRGTKLNMAVKGMEFGGLSSTLLQLHQQVRVVAKFGLREYETFLMMSRKWKDWSSVATRDQEGAMLPDFIFAKAEDFEVNRKGDDDKVRDIVTAMAKTGGAEAHAKLIIQQNRALRQQRDQYSHLLDLFEVARGLADDGKDFQKYLMGLHWDLLQHLG